MKWSRTDTMYMVGAPRWTNRLCSLRVPDAVAQGVARGRHAEHDLGQLLEIALARDQTVEHRIVEHRQRQLHAPARVPPRALRLGQASHLRGLQRKSLRMKGLAERQGDGLTSVPAQLHDRRLEPRNLQGEPEPVPRTA